METQVLTGSQMDLQDHTGLGIILSYFMMCYTMLQIDDINFLSTSVSDYECGQMLC